MSGRTRSHLCSIPLPFLLSGFHPKNTGLVCQNSVEVRIDRLRKSMYLEEQAVADLVLYGPMVGPVNEARSQKMEAVGVVRSQCASGR